MAATEAARQTVWRSGLSRWESSAAPWLPVDPGLACDRGRPHGPAGRSAAGLAGGLARPQAGISRRPGRCIVGSGGADPVSRYNRFVMDPDSEDPDELRSELGEFGVLVDVVQFALGAAIPLRRLVRPPANWRRWCCPHRPVRLSTRAM